MSLPIPPEHLAALVAALRADGVAWLNVGADWRREWVTCDGRCDPSTGAFKHRPDCTGKPIHTLTAPDDGPYPMQRGWGKAKKNIVSVDVVVTELVPNQKGIPLEYVTKALGPPLTPDDWVARIEVES